MTAPNKKNRLVSVLTPIGIIIALVFAGLYLIKTFLVNPSETTRQQTTANRTQVPDFALYGDFSNRYPDGVKLSEIKAKVIMLNFWATWCEACMVEMPSIVALWKQYHNQGLEILAINLDDNPAAVVPRVMKRYNMEFPVFQDKDGGIAELFDVHAIPLTVIVNHNRKILVAKDGDQDWNNRDVRQQMERWLKE